jgi:hypothetical protein
MVASNSVSSIQQLYISYFGRPADPAGLVFWVALADKNAGSLESIMAAFTGAPEAIALYGGADTVDARIDAIYQNVFGRRPDTEGKAFWKILVESKEIALENLTLAILTGAHGNADAVLVKNKLAVAQAFTARIEAGEAAYEGVAAAAVARTLLKSVTSDAASVNAALAKLPAYLNTLGVASKVPEKFAALIENGVLKDPSIVSSTLTAETVGSKPSGPLYVAPKFTVTEGLGDEAGQWTVGAQNGKVALSMLGGGETMTYVFTPASGSAVMVLANSVKSLIVNSITLGSTGAILDGMSISGTGHVAVSELQMIADTDLSGIQTAQVTADLNLGSVSISAKGEDAGTVRTLDFSNVTLIVGGDYEVDIGDDSFEYVPGTADTQQSIAAGFAALIKEHGGYEAGAVGTLLTISAGAGTQDIEFELEASITGSLGKAAVTITGMGEVVVYPEADLGTATFAVPAGIELEGSAGQLSGKTVTGAGRLSLHFDNSSPLLDDSHFAASLDVTAEIRGTVDLSEHSFSRVDAFELYWGARLTITAQQAAGIELRKDAEEDGEFNGSVIIRGSDGDQIIDLTGSSGAASLNVIEGGKGADRIILGDGADKVVVGAGTDGSAADSYWSVEGGTWDRISQFGEADTLDLGDAGLLSAEGVINGVATGLTGGTVAELLASLATLMGGSASVAAFVHGENTYVFQGNGVAGVQQGDVFIELIGVQLETLEGVVI